MTACGWAIALPVTYWSLHRFWIRSSSQDVLERHLTDDQMTRQSSQRSWLGRWLYKAGFRTSTTTRNFLLLSLVSLTIGGLFVWVVTVSEIIPLAEGLLRSIPGAVGEVFLPFLWASPWIAGTLIALIPVVIVRQFRQRRIRKVEQDLPISLDLLSALAEAGVGFDAAIDRIVNVLPDDRPLAKELQLFQLDLLAGRRRIESLKRLRDRVDVPWFTIFISAVMHAEQIGSGLAATLKIQAEDLRIRRRERALAAAMGVPIKLLLPLVVCFLPGIMVASLGPISFQIVQVLDQFLQGTAVP